MEENERKGGIPRSPKRRLSDVEEDGEEGGGGVGDALGATERQDMQMGHLGITMRWEERRKAALLGAARKQRGGSLTFV